ncbi:ABC transporter permease [Microcoleus sp. FACHB-1515]|uniref:ABC transporter permease n=1 Tax=Cyanophyceae TaxID=3028117 RepID=UPI001688953E|nr:ABC transporter permease [Microcoleus sp. FACHB-1515]MBD2088482.1 ABC transporter permease [Microcoleus sp. FACHB-1515]
MARSKTEIGFHRAWENYRDLLFVLVEKEMQVRYHNKGLGYLWSVANPLASAIVFYIAFKVMMRVTVEDYTLVLMAGIFPWQWFSNSVNSAPRIFVGNASLIKKVRFPRNILPLSMVLNNFIHFLLSIPVIVILLFFFGESVSWAWIYGIPLLSITTLIMVYGISVFLGTINLFFRDLERLTAIIMQFAFYLTPIVYTEDMIPEAYKYLIYFSPIAPLMINWRRMFLYGTMDFTYLLASFIYGLAFLAIGQWVYNKLSWKFGEVI